MPYCPHLRLILHSQIDKAGARGRTNDLGRLRDHILEYAGISGRENLAHLANRGNRGFKDPTLGRLLCPIKKLAEFDADPAAYVLHGFAMLC